MVSPENGFNLTEILPARFKLAVAIGASLIIGNLVSVAMWKFIKRKLSNVPPKKYKIICDEN